MIYKITKEHEMFNDEKFSRKIRMTEEYTEQELNELLPNMVHEFRCLDDDNIPYFYGLSSDDSSFAPLNRVGLAYGCTTIQYKNKYGKFETL